MKEATVLVIGNAGVASLGKCVCGNEATHFCDATIIADHEMHVCATPICDSCTHAFTVDGVLSDRKIHVHKNSSRFIPTALRDACPYCKEKHKIKCPSIGSDACFAAQKEMRSWKITISAKKLANKFNSTRR